MADIEKFPISHYKRDLNRRGKKSLSCIISDRWIKVGKPHHEQLELGTPIELEVLTANNPSTAEDYKICSMKVTVEQLRDLLAEIEREAGA
ncbi:hypothetical protein GCM10007908_01800 [Rhizobium albus]|nr:hypothetical protein GCM10007908_01800 [Rhizobium albus]